MWKAGCEGVIFPVRCCMSGCFILRVRWASQLSITVRAFDTPMPNFHVIGHGDDYQCSEGSHTDRETNHD